MSQDEVLRVGTTRADLDYHAAHATYRDVQRSQARLALCGRAVIITPHAWDDVRQRRQDSCAICVRRAGRLFEAEEKARGERMPMVAGYIRASTDRQVESPDVQEQIIRDYSRRNALAEPRLWIDPATSGKTPMLDRPAGREMIRQLRRGDHVVVARIDRLSRNFMDFATTIDNWSRIGVTLHPCDFPMRITPDDPLSMAFIHMLAIFATYERRMISQRTRESKHHLRQLGRKIQGDAPFGWRWERKADGKQYRVIDEFEAAVCLKCVELHVQGYNLLQITNYLNIEWGIRNPRSERTSSGRARARSGDPARYGHFRYQYIARYINHGLKILMERGEPLPEGLEPREDNP